MPLRHLLNQQPRVATSVVTMTHTDDFPYDLLPGTKPDWSRVRKYPIYFYTYQDHVIWGITAVGLLLVANAIRMIVKRGKDELAHPELYKRGKRAEAKLQKKLAKMA